MASEDENNVSTDTAPGLPEVAAPVKKAAAKRAPRKATKKASVPKQAPELEPIVSADAVQTVVDAPIETTAAPTRKTAKRAPRKTARKAVAASVDLSPAPVDPVPADVAPAVPVPADVAPADPVSHDAAPASPAPAVPEPEPEKAPAVQNFGLLFQPPAPTAAPRRRRASAPAAEPTPAVAPSADQAPGQQTPSPVASGQAESERQNSDGGSEESTDSETEGAPRRRRRGGKGRRGRATGEGVDESSTSADPSSQDATGTDSMTDARPEASTEADQDRAQETPAHQPADEDSGSGESGDSRHRTRRRRRSTAGSGDGDEQQSNGSTTTRVREPRPKRDEVTAVKGSTRLEAKKLRRREGREAGRRRTVITEAEFLARRESVERVMVVRHKEDRTQIGVLEDGVLVEHYVSRETNASMAGNVYLGRIQNVLPSMEAAFVDIGKGRNAVLYAGEVNWDAAGLDNRAKRIENALSSGQSVLVQVTKDPIGHKGARLTSQVSLPGRYLVYVPDGNMMGISRKLPDTERARLKKILREVVPENAGVIVRTAAEGASEDELRADVTRLTATWQDIQAKSKSANAPALLHGEPDLTVRVIRDVFNEDFAKLVVSGDPAWDAVSGYVHTVAPDLADRIQKWTGEQDLFTHHRVDEQIAKAMDRKVWLPSGGTLVIDRTEAMTVVDVNTGKFVGSGGNLEETVTKNNIEAAEEVVRQLRLRDIGGIIVIDFIDMVLESNRDLVVRRLLECLGRDRTKHQVAEVTSLGLVQMTRKRVGAGLIEVFSQECDHCNGRGIIVSADPIDRPSGNDGSGGGSNSGGGKNNSGNSSSGGNTGSSSGNSGGGSGDSGGRGTRSRRSRGTGRDASGSVATEPPVPTGGPTPAQIAAAAHAAAIQAKPQGVRTEPEPRGRVETSLEPSREVEPSVAESSVAEAAVAEAAVAEAPVVEPAVTAAEPAVTAAELGQGQGGQRGGSPVQVVVPRKPRRQSSRSASAPAISQAPPAPPATDHRVTRPAHAEPVTIESATAPDQVSAPVVRSRRKRPRVLAPAGPPPGAGKAEEASGEFGS